MKSNYSYPQLEPKSHSKTLPRWVDSRLSQCLWAGRQPERAAASAFASACWFCVAGSTGRDGIPAGRLYHGVYKQSMRCRAVWCCGMLASENMHQGRLAQMAERSLSMREAPGSIPGLSRVCCDQKLHLRSSPEDQFVPVTWMVHMSNSFLCFCFYPFWNLGPRAEMPPIVDGAGQPDEVAGQVEFCTQCSSWLAQAGAGRAGLSGLELAEWGRPHGLAMPSCRERVGGRGNLNGAPWKASERAAVSKCKVHHVSWYFNSPSRCPTRGDQAVYLKAPATRALAAILLFDMSKESVDDSPGGYYWGIWERLLFGMAVLIFSSWVR